ncbi:helix-turn-helix transcriptional regulator [Nocardiopsis aegyptia]
MFMRSHVWLHVSMPPKTTPSEQAAINQFGSELRRLRTLADMSQLDIGRLTGTSKQQVGAVERGIRRPSKKFAELADRALKCNGGLLNLWPGAKQTQPWWLEKFVEIERKTQVIQDFQPQVAPGLLQIESYARAVMWASFPPQGQQELEERLKRRMDRQKILDRENPPLALFVVEEGALRRSVGGADVMKDQYKALIARARMPHLRLQVLPFDRGAHSAMDWAFMIMRMTPVESLVYAEAPGGGHVITDVSVVADCQQRFSALQSMALSPNESIDFIASLGETT